MSQWELEVHQRVADAIRQRRGTHSAQWLADRTAELGFPISRAQIANYESGRKKSLDIAELLVIAAALDTSPVLLLYPGPYGDNVEVLPGQETSEFMAAQWFSGNGYWKVDPDATAEANSQIYNARLLNRWRELDRMEVRRIWLASLGDDADREQIAHYDDLIRQHRAELEAETDGYLTRHYRTGEVETNG